MLRGALGIAGLLLTSCSSAVYVQANLQGYGLEVADLAHFRAFVAEVDANSPNPLRDQAVLRLAAAELSARGLENRGVGAATADDEFGLTLRLSVEESAVEVPQEVRVYESYRPGHVWRTRAADGGHWITVRSPGEWYPQTWISGGYTMRITTHTLTLQFRDGAGREIWRGDLSATGESGDLLAVMRACLPALLAEFPGPSGLAADRRIRVDAGAK